MPDGLVNETFIAVASMFESTRAITGAGLLRCWGGSDPPADLMGTPVTAVCTGNAHSGVITAANSAVRCWGGNSDNELAVPAELNARQWQRRRHVRLVQGLRLVCGRKVGGRELLGLVRLQKALRLRRPRRRRAPFRGQATPRPGGHHGGWRGAVLDVR